MAACSSSGVGVCRGGVVFCAVVRAGAWCCVCALPGLRVARAPCPGVLLRRRGDTPSLWRARLAPWRALLVPGCGPARGSGVCVRWGGGVWFLPPCLPRLVSLSLFPSLPCLPTLFVPVLAGRLVLVACLGVSFLQGGVAWVRFGNGLLVWCAVPRVRCPGPPGPCSLACMPSVWCCACGVLGRFAPVHRCARSVCGVACTVSWAPWLLFTGVHALCVVLRVRCPGPPGSCSPVCTLCVWCRVYGVLGLLAPVHRCARSVCGVVCMVSWVAWLLFTGVRVLCVVLCERCPGPLAPVHRCARSVCGVVCTVSWASRLLFTGVHALCVVLRVRCPGPLGSCSPVCSFCVWCCVYGVLGLLAPVHRCARSVCGVACTVSWASWILFTGVHVQCVVLRVRCPGPPGPCSPVCTPCVWCCWCGVLGRLAPVHRRARSVCGVVCAVSWAAWLLCTGVPALVCCVLCTVSWAPWLRFTGVHALCAVSCAWSPGPFGPFLLVCSCGVRCVVCVVSLDTWFVFSGVAVCCGVSGVRCAVLRVRCPGPPSPCSPVRTPGVWCCVGGVLGRLAPVHRCACAVCCVVCLVSWASWLPVTGVPVWRVLGGVCGVPGYLAPVHRRALCLFGVLCVVRGVPGHAAPVHRYACSVCCVVCVLWVWVCARVCHTVLVAFFVAPKSRRRPCIHGSDTVKNAAANSPLVFRPRSCPASYEVLLILPVLDSLFLATPKSKRVLMHAWRCKLFTRWFVYSLYFATPKSRRVCVMHS